MLLLVFRKSEQKQDSTKYGVVKQLILIGKVHVNSDEDVEIKDEIMVVQVSGQVIKDTNYVVFAVPKVVGNVEKDLATNEEDDV